MMELLDTSPPIAIDPAEFARLLGYPPGHTLTGRAYQLARWAQSWYAQHGRPWLYARQTHSLSITPGTITLDDTPFSSPRLEQTLTAAQSAAAFLVAVSAGPQAEAHAHQLWLADRPDEYFFLEIYASAVVEYLTTIAGARLCAWADQNKLAVLPHYSPGYPEWDIAQQPQLRDLITRGTQSLPHDLEVLPTGMLRPKKSLIAVFGLTPRTAQTPRLTTLIPCQNCSFARCQFRRAPYSRTNTPDLEVAAATEQTAPESPDSPPPATEPESPPPPISAFSIQHSTFPPTPTYSTNPRALQRWTTERLTLTTHPDGTTHATFRYDGTTCSNMGRPLAFLYHITLGTRAQGYPIQHLLCTPAPDDEGHKSMCRYLSHPDLLMSNIAQEKPLLGQPLQNILTWPRPTSGGASAGCYCESSSRQHKWVLALETLHFALAQLDLSRAANLQPTGV